MPPVIRLAVEAASKAIMSEAGNAAGNLEFIAFTTNDSTEAVKAFTTNERMAAEGWTTGDEPRRVAGAGYGQLAGGGGFVKDGDDVFPMLIIDVWEGNGRTLLFTIRIGEDE